MGGEGSGGVLRYGGVVRYAGHQIEPDIIATFFSCCRGARNDPDRGGHSVDSWTSQKV